MSKTLTIDGYKIKVEHCSDCKMGRTIYCDHPIFDNDDTVLSPECEQMLENKIPEKCPLKDWKE